MKFPLRRLCARVRLHQAQVCSFTANTRTRLCVGKSKRYLLERNASTLLVAALLKRKPLPNDATEKKHSKEPSKPSLGSADFRRILKYAKPEMRWLTAGTGFMVVTTGVNMVVPAAFGRVIDIATGAATGITLSQLSIALSGVFVLGGIANAGRIYCFSRTGHCVVRRIRRDVFNNLTAQELGYFEKNPTGDLISRLTNDTTLLGEAFGGLTLCAAMRNCAQIIGSFTFMAYLSPELTKVTLFILPIGACASLIYGRFIRNTQMDVQKTISKMSAFAEERLSNIQLVRAFNNERFENHTFRNKHLNGIFKASMRQTKGNSLFHGSTGAIGNLFMLSVLTYGGTLVNDGVISSGVLTSFLMYSVYVGMSVIGFTSNFTAIMRGVGASQKVFEIIDRKPLIHNELGIPLSAASIFHSLHIPELQQTSEARVLSDIANGRNDALADGRQEEEGKEEEEAGIDNTTLAGMGAAVNNLQKHDVRISDICFRDVVFRYPTRPESQVLNGLNLHIKEGESLAVVGESGSGKSTLFALLLRMYDIDSGELSVRLKKGTIGGAQSLRQGNTDSKQSQTKTKCDSSDSTATVISSAEMLQCLNDSSGDGAKVLVDDAFDEWVAIGELRPVDIRAQVAVVSQESALFDASIRDNVCYGLMQPTRFLTEEELSASQSADRTLDADLPLTEECYQWLDAKQIPQSRMEAACKLANAHEFILQMSDGYDTCVGQHSVSGGQKQRLSIARAMLRQPEMLLLDEATSALDAQSEALVADALANALKGRTSVVIAHRLSTIRQCDSIAVMRAGKVVERGTHNELMAVDAYYADLVRKQLY